MRVYLGSDHAGYEFKQAIITHLTKTGHEAIDCGAFTYDADDDRRRSGQPRHRARRFG